MMGIPIEGHAHVRIDNMSVVNNTMKLESMLEKKSMQLLTTLSVKA